MAPLVTNVSQTHSTSVPITNSDASPVSAWELQINARVPIGTETK